MLGKGSIKSVLRMPRRTQASHMNARNRASCSGYLLAARSAPRLQGSSVMSSRARAVASSPRGRSAAAPQKGADMEAQSTKFQQMIASSSMPPALVHSSAPPQEKGAIGIAFLVWLFGGGLGLALLIFILLKLF